MNDLILVENIKQDKDLEFSLENLYLLHCNIFYKMINNYISDSNKSLKEELSKECKYHIFFAAKDFKYDKKSKFSTYLANRTKWMCLNINTKNKKNVNNLSSLLETNKTIELNFQNQTSSEINMLIKSELISNIFSLAETSQDERIAKIFNLRYKEGLKNKVMPWRSVSKRVGLSIQGCINIHNNFINNIKEGVLK